MSNPNVDFVLPKEEPWTDKDLARIEGLKQAHQKILGQVRKAVVGQDTVVHLTMIGLFSQGHCLLMGVPGLGKTLLVRTLASSNAAWVLGGVRLISSASRMLVKIGPARNFISRLPLVRSSSRISSWASTGWTSET